MKTHLLHLSLYLTQTFSYLKFFIALLKRSFFPPNCCGMGTPESPGTWTWSYLLKQDLVLVFGVLGSSTMGRFIVGLGV